MHVAGTLPYDGSERDLDLDQWLVDGWQDELIDAFLDGASPEELMEILHDHMSGDMPPFYAQFFDPTSDESWQLDIDTLDWGFDE